MPNVLPTPIPIPRASSRAALASMIEQVERRGGCRGAEDAIATGFPPPLDRLTGSAVHEWFCESQADERSWSAPLHLFVHLAGCCVQAADGVGPPGVRLAVWVGRALWPQPHAMIHRCGDGDQDRTLLDRSLFIDPASEGDRLWAIDLCLRSSAVAVVAADGRGLRMAHSRRLQLAAEAGGGLALLARPEEERSIPSATLSRWSVAGALAGTAASDGIAHPRWRVELVRCKGVRRWSGIEAHASLVLEHAGATCGLRIPADVAERCDEASSRASRRIA